MTSASRFIIRRFYILRGNKQYVSYINYRGLVKKGSTRAMALNCRFTYYIITIIALMALLMATNLKTSLNACRPFQSPKIEEIENLFGLELR